MSAPTSNTLKVMFDCHVCGLKDEEVIVPARSPDQPLREWMELVRRDVGRVHALRSLLCESKVCDLKIPMAGESNYIGQPEK